MDGTNIYSMFTMAKARVDTVHGGCIWSKPIGNDVVHTLTFTLKNYGTVPAVFNRIRCTRSPAPGVYPTTGGYKFDYTDRILPIHFSENYFSLAPGDSQTIIIQFDDSDLGAGNHPVVSVEGINMLLDTIPMAGNVAVLPRNTLVGNTTKAGIYTVVTGNNLKLCNIPLGSQWQACLYTLQGQTVLNTRGVANSSATLVSTAHLRPGVYVIELKSGEQIFRYVVTIKQ
jgi:hypothetical protein